MTITGYPGEKGKLGYLFKGKGKLIAVEKTPAGGLIAYYTAYTTPGVSGSMVVIENQHMLELAIDSYIERAKKGDPTSM